jgi:hypothetical protein
MNKPFRRGTLVSLGALLFGALCVPATLHAQSSTTSTMALTRLSAEFRNFDGTESTTAVGVPGISVYSKTVSIPGPSPLPTSYILYVTISATGDTQGGAASWFTCLVDKVFCNPGKGGGSGAPAGWVALQRHGVELPDNDIHYTWCARIEPGTHTVQIRMASSTPGDQVAIETAFFYIDWNTIGVEVATGCNPGMP